MSQWVAVHGLSDGRDVNAETLNAPLFELTERTNYLYNWMRQLSGTSPFESVRIMNAALTTTGALAPAVKDVVCLDPTTKTYVKAMTSMSLIDEFAASDSSYAIGVLIDKQGSRGTVLVAGKLPLSTGSNAWALADLLETGEEFRNGRYYVSATEPGKMTATPSGPVIYVGMFTESTSLPGYGDYAVVNPQYRDTGESHVHRTYRMATQPAGRQHVTEAGPDGVHYVIGFPPDGAGDEYDVLPRLVLYGNWTGPASAQYRIWLSTATGTDQATAPAPTTFDDTYLHWTSSDPDEAPGSVRVMSFEVPVAIGTSGLYGVLENVTAVTAWDASAWDIPYGVTESVLTPDKRTWTVTVPEDTQGWLARRYTQYFDDHPAIDGLFSFVLMGGPHSSADQRTHDTINIACAELHVIDFDGVLPVTGDTLAVGASVFEFVDAADELSVPEYTPVIITGDTDTTYENLLDAVLDAAPAGVVPVLHNDGTAKLFMLGTPAGTVVTHLGAAVVPESAGAGLVTGTAALLVYDERNRNLVAERDSSFYWTSVTLWEPVRLLNNLLIMPIPYDVDGRSCLVHGNTNIANGDTWVTEIADTAPGAAFVYAMGMHPGLNGFYPPIPVKAAALELNGVQLDSAEFYPGEATYLFGLDSVYWYPSAYGTVPWPSDWETPALPGSDYLRQKLLIHFVRNTIGNTGYVTSLRPATNSPIKVLQCGTNDDGTVGDLMLDLDLTIEAEDAGLTGYNVVKTASGNKLKRGPVVEKILPGPGITVTQQSGAPAGQGIVTIGLADSNGYTGEFEEVALQNAKQEMIGMFPYVRLLGWTTGGTNTPTGFTAKFRVPHTIARVPYRVVVYATVFGESAVPWVQDMVLPRAGLEFTYAVLPDVYPIGGAVEDPVNSLNLMEELVEPDSVRAVELRFGKSTMLPGTTLAYKAYDPMLVHNFPQEPDANKEGQKQQALGTPFPSQDDIAGSPASIGVMPGSLVAVRFSRASLNNATAEYTGAIGFINLRWMLVTVN